MIILTGNFTEKQLINPSDNLIVCGLHSLYGDNNALYNLKIFMDTDETLKEKWKIKRDVKRKGYSIEKVLNSIKKREEDYKNISYLKRGADLIIKFSAENMNLYNLDYDDSLILELKINNKFNIDKIQDILNTNSIKYEVKFGELDTFVFREYKPLHYDKIIQIHNYYQYILFSFQC